MGLHKFCFYILLGLTLTAAGCGTDSSVEIPEADNSAPEVSQEEGDAIYNSSAQEQR